ncbi:MAG: fold metallo-hydrolase [Solirubrobacterales bacterium]|nr:fold metallo-hydrolase [Solirubrobacterales bacterium]
MTDHLRVLEPGPGLLAFYDGRVEGYRFDAKPNWVDDGALGLGIASYAIVDGEEALVYDTGTTPAHGRLIREELGRRGVSRFTVVLSHWHLDHVAGTEAFVDSPVISNERTAEHLREKRAAIEDGTLEGPPAISPLVMPTRTFAERETLSVGGEAVELIAVNVHSDDATVLWLPERRLLLCGDTMEDTVTYVGEPDQFDAHLRDLERLRELDPDRILPAHGDPDRIAGGGYPPGLNEATQSYIRLLQRMASEPELREVPLCELIADSLASGSLQYFEPYEAIHRQNLETVLTAGGA